MLKLIQVVSLVTLAFACSPPQGWKVKPMLERVADSKLLVYGQVLSASTTPTNGGINTIAYKLEVLCILKKEGISQSIGSSLVIEEFDPTPQCVSNKNWMKDDNKIIVMLREHDDKKKFNFDNVNVQSAVFAGNSTTLQEIVDACDASVKPSGSQCPQKSKTQTCSASGAAGCHVIEFITFLVAFVKIVF